MDSPDKGLFMSLLAEISRPGEMIRDLMVGKMEGAGRQLGQLGLNAVDSVLPGDWLPNEFAREEDYTSGEELLKSIGIDAGDGIGGSLAGFAAEMATDPLTYVPGAALAKVGTGVGKVATTAATKVAGKEAVDTGLKALGTAGRHVRSTFGAVRLPEPIRKVVDAARGGKLAGNAGLMASQKALEGLDERQLNIIGDALDNFKWENGKLVGELVPTSSDPIRGVQSGGLLERIAAHPELGQGEIDRLLKAAEDIAEIGRNQKGRKGIFTGEQATEMDLATGKRTPLMAHGGMSDEYLARSYDGLPEEDMLNELVRSGSPNPMKERKLEGFREVSDFLGKKGNEKVTYQRNALKRMLSRSDAQGKLAQRADIGQGLMDLLRSGAINAPDDLLEEAARAASVKGPVGETGAADINRMLGGDTTDLAHLDPYGTDLGAKAKATGQAPSDVNQMLGGGPTEALNPGVQSGDAVVGARTAKKVLGDLTPEQKAAGKAKLLERDFSYANPEHRSLINGTIQEMAKTDPESAKYLYDAMNGMPARGWITSLLAKSNSVFKPFATAGYILPKLGFSVRNRLSGIWQTMSNPETRGVIGEGALRAPGDVISAIAEGMGLKTGDRLGSAVSAWDDALRNSGGSAEKALAEYAKVHPDAAALIKAGGLDGFVRSEDLLKEMTSNGTLAKLHKMAKWPAKITKGVEDRMRLGLGMDLIAAGKSPDDAAKIVRDTLFDYDVNSASNRTYRDVIPFGQFLGKAVPQQAALLAEKPYVASAIANAMGDDEDVMPHMVGRLNIPLGDDNYISGLGLPFEALSSIPNPTAGLRDFGRQVEKNVVGSSQPLLKSAFATVSGEDPFFGSEYGSYSKLPGGFEGGEAGRIYNQLAGAGLPGISQFDALARTVGKGVDDRKSAGLRALDLLTGANVTTVDPDMALQQRLNEALARNPDVMNIRTPINTSSDPETQAMINELRALRRRQKEKREAEALKGDIL